MSSQPARRFGDTISELAKKYTGPTVYNDGLSWLKQAAVEKAYRANWDQTAGAKIKTDIDAAVTKMGKATSYEQLQFSTTSLPADNEHNKAITAGIIDFLSLHKDNLFRSQLPERIVEPTEKDDMFRIKDSLRSQQGAYIPVTDEEINYKIEKSRESALGDFHQWIHTHYNYRDPVTKNWLMQVYPEFFEWKKKMMEQDHDIEWRKKVISNFGPNNFEDLIMEYMMDTGVVKSGESMALDTQRDMKTFQPYSMGGNYVAYKPGDQLPAVRLASGDITIDKTGMDKKAPMNVDMKYPLQSTATVGATSRLGSLWYGTIGDLVNRVIGRTVEYKDDDLKGVETQRFKFGETP